MSLDNLRLRQLEKGVVSLESSPRSQGELDTWKISKVSTSFGSLCFCCHSSITFECFKLNRKRLRNNFFYGEHFFGLYCQPTFLRYSTRCFCDELKFKKTTKNRRILPFGLTRKSTNFKRDFNVFLRKQMQ